MATSIFDSALYPLKHLDDNPERVPFDYNQTSTSNGLPKNSVGGPIQSTNTKGIEFQYNHQAYSVEVSLNNLNASQAQLVSPDSIVELFINDTFATWVIKGTLTLRNVLNTIENSYSFRNDGYDTLSIRIFPTTPSSQKVNVIDPTTGLAVTDTQSKDWELNYLFSIYNIQDIPLPPGAEGAASGGIKCKKFYFRDIRYHELSTKTIQYSTALSPKLSNVTANSTDIERSLPTGEIIKEILQTAITDNNLNKVTTNSSDWDTGASKLFITSPANITAYDLLMYVYNRHVSTIASNNINDFCILGVERGPSPGQKGIFVLRPLSKYFEKAGKDIKAPGVYHIENFFIQAPDDNIKKVGASKRTPLKRTYTSYSNISHFEYMEIAPDTNAHLFVTKPVCSYDLGKREFNIEFNGNDVVSAKNFINEKYVSQLVVTGGNNVQITLDRGKKDLNIKPVFSLYGTDRILREADGIIDLLKIGVFQNACITFTVPGLTSRETGKFIGIDYMNGSVGRKFDDKLCGQWFIIDVKHIFRGATYSNEITAIKLHQYQTPDKFPNTL